MAPPRRPPSSPQPSQGDRGGLNASGAGVIALGAGLIALGAIAGAYGVKGWVRIKRFAVDGDVLQVARPWWLINGEAQELVVEDVQQRSSSVVAKWRGYETKEAADALKGRTIAVARADFPPLPQGEHYLVDIAGSQVINRDGAVLGSVSGLRVQNQGPRMQWLEVDGNADAMQLLIPLNDYYVDAIDAANRVIKVDWQRDW